MTSALHKFVLIKKKNKKKHLGKEDVKVIAFRCSLPENMKQSSALDVLDYLCKHAKFSPTNIQPLAELLTDAYRSDLVNNYVEEYRLKYGTTKYVDPYAILESYASLYSSYSDGSLWQYANQLHAYLADYKCMVFQDSARACIMESLQ